MKKGLNKCKCSFEEKKMIEIETIDGFQGREKDVILFSTVRSGNSIGFLKDYRRMNVALSRAKHLLVLIGKGDTLKQDETWNQIISH